MAYKWIIGDFDTGSISETNELPVVLNKGDKISVDVNADEAATLTLSMHDLPSDWMTYLSPANKMVAYVDTDAVWSSGVVWAGFINKVSASVNDTVKVQAAGLKEYMKMRSTNNVFGSTNTNPKATIDFNGSNYQNLMGRIIQSCFSTTGIPSTSSRPPQVLISVATGTSSGTAATYSVPVNDSEFYANVLDSLRDELSDKGQEYWFVPQWRSSSKTQIGWVAYVGSSSVPHRQENTTLTVDLGDGNNNTFKPTAFGQTASSDNMVSRIIGISKEGDDTTPSDLTTKTTRTYTNILIDEFWNPGIELTSTELNDQLTQRLSYNSQTFKESNFTTVFDDKSYIKTHSLNIGKMATFTSSGNVQNFGLTMRVVGVSVSFGGNTAEIELAPKAARYPRLPKDGRNLKPKTEAPKTGRPKTGTGGSGDYGDYVKPITPAPKPGDNGTTTIPGGIPEPPEPVIPPPFTNPKDIYDDTESVIENVDKRWFKPATVVAAEADDANIKNHWHPYPSAVKSRFNYNTGEYIGLNAPSQNVWVASPSREITTVSTIFPIKIYSMNVPQMFNRDNNPYKNEIQDTTTAYANDDADLKIIGEIDSSLYEDLIVSGEDFVQDLPAVYRNNNSYTSNTAGGFEYIFFCSEDFQTLYVQIVFGASTMFRTAASADSQLYSVALSKVLKGVRNSEGVVETWESLGQAFTKNQGSEDAEVFVSPNIYEINGEFVSFGGYFFPQAEEQVWLENDGYQTTAQKIAPYYGLYFYSSDFYKITPEQPWQDTKVDYELSSGTNEFYKSGGYVGEIDEYKIPYSVKVDYNLKKIYLGIVKSMNNSSMFFESSFDNFQFQKNMESDRYKNYDGALVHNNNKITGRDYGPHSLYYKHFNNPCIIYKNNIISIVPNGGELDEGTYYNTYTAYLTSETEVGTRSLNKSISYLRGKKGYEDVIAGESVQPVSTVSNHITGQKMDNMLNLSYMINNNSNWLNHYTSLRGAPRSSPYSLEVFVQGGWDYFMYEGYLYIIADSNLVEIQSPTNVSRDSIRFNYWVGKFRFKDELL